MEAGIPVKAAITGRGRIQAGELPAGKVVSAWHLGPYHKLQESYGKLEAWLKEHKHSSRGGAWEIYWTDPGLEPDQRKWCTQILWPIE